MHDSKILKDSSHCSCLSVQVIDFVFRTGRNYYPQVLLGKCKYIVKVKKMTKYIADTIEMYSDDSDEEISKKENSDDKNMMKKIKRIIEYIENYSRIQKNKD